MKDKFNICVLGYHYRPKFYEFLNSIRDWLDICVVRRGLKQDEPIGSLNDGKAPIEGLDFGGYDYYLKNVWDGKSPVLYMHDDTKMNIKGLDVVSRYSSYDRVFFFGSERSKIMYKGKSARAFYCSRKFMKAMLNFSCECEESRDHINPFVGWKVPGIGPHNGFMHDPYNTGVVENEDLIKPMRDANVGIRHFEGLMDRITKETGEVFNGDVPVVTRDLWPGIRNRRFI